MVKKIRSLIQEKIPFDMRVEIELLSKRRDLIPSEKFEKLLELFKSSGIDIIPIGPGTNRYGFKLNGFAVKIATNEEGKIDNLKEFKMAKRLYPYVIRVHEVSSNGTILVCEYIQPFMSYTEMCMYSDQIKKILEELSSVYLIGDVGISANNFGNWGLRMGTDDPVCLDFAYVYSVSSNLFTCTKTNCKGVMIPDDNFVGLYCNVCRAPYSFQDIRARLANDLHSLEIGDLTTEGYVMREAETVMELDTERSNYLLATKEKEKKSSKKQKVAEAEEVPFIMEHDLKHYKEETKMSLLRVLEVTAKMVDNGDIQIPHGTSSQKKVHERHPINQPDWDNDEPDVIEAGEGIAFSTTITPTADVIDVEPTETSTVEATVVEATVVETPEADTNEESVEPAPADEETPTEVEEQVDSDEEPEETLGFVTEETPQTVEAVAKEVEKKPVVEATVKSVQAASEENEKQESPRKRYTDIDEFKDFGDLDRAVSIVTYKILDSCKDHEMYEQLQPDLGDKRLFKENFYKILSGSIYVTLMNFVGYHSTDVPNTNGKGTHKEFTPPGGSLKGTKHEPTIIFINRFYNTREINQAPNGEAIMAEYKKLYNDHQGIQSEWINLFSKNLLKKINISGTGMIIIKNFISDLWCTDETVATPIVPEPSAPETGAAVQVPVEEEAPVETTAEDVALSVVMNNTADEPEVEEQVESDECECGDKCECDECNCDECSCECDDEDDDTRGLISVYLYPDDKGIDVIRLNVPNEFGEISIPMYTVLDDIDVENTEVTTEYPENGVYDWLKHQAPDIMFRTQNPEQYLNLNKVPFHNEYGVPRFIILGKVHTNEEPATYIVALYYLEGMFIVDDSGDYELIDSDNYVLLERLNRIIRQSTSGSISHYIRTMAAIELVHEESYIQDLLDKMEEIAETENELAAINAVLSNANPDGKIDPELINEINNMMNVSNETNQPIITAQQKSNVVEENGDLVITPIVGRHGVI